MDACTLIAALETHVQTTSGGWANEKALAEFRRLARDLINALDRPQLRYRVEFACELAEHFYSARSHRRRGRGAANVHSAILADLASIRNAIAAA